MSFPGLSNQIDFPTCVLIRNSCERLKLAAVARTLRHVHLIMGAHDCQNTFAAVIGQPCMLHVSMFNKLQGYKSNHTLNRTEALQSKASLKLIQAQVSAHSYRRSVACFIVASPQINTEDAFASAGVCVSQHDHVDPIGHEP